MSKKWFSILFCIGILAITTVLLLVFVVNKDEKIDLSLNKALTSKADDISVAVGNRVYDFYEISNKTAELSFEMDKEGIIYINEEYIEGLQVGKVNVIMTAKTQKQTTRSQFNVTVYENEYSFEFVSVYGCTFDNNNIYATAEAFQFNLEVYDKQNIKVENIDYSIISNNDETVIDKSFSSVLVVARENCTLTFIFKDLSVTFSKNVILET